MSIDINGQQIFSMNSILRKKESAKPNSSSKSENPNSDPKWQKENEILQATAEANSRLHEQITKQSYADSAVQNAIQDKVCDLKQKAVKLAKTLESQKRKNIQLEAIIRHMKYIMEEDKKVQATHRDDMNFQNMDNLSRKIKKLEYDLEQMYSKINDLNSKIRIQKNQIDASRTQRVIDSTIFLKIQKQLVALELEYKKLLIQKTKYEKEYHKSLQNYRKIKTDIEREHTNISKRISIEKNSIYEKQDHFFENAPQIEQAVKFTDITNITEGGKKKNTPMKRYSVYNEGNKEVNQELQIKVKKVFLQTGLTNVEQLIDHLTNIDHINQQLFEELNKKSDQVANMKEQLKRSIEYRKNNTVRYYDKVPQVTKAQLEYMNCVRLDCQIQDTDQNMKKQMEQLQQFLTIKEKEQFVGLFSSNFCQQQSENGLNKRQDDKGLEDVVEFFSTLEQKITPILQNYQQLKQKFTQCQQQNEKTQRNKKFDSKDETIDDMIGKVKKIEESEKIMVREEFKRQYENLKKTGKSIRNQGKRKTTLIMRNR